MKHVGSFRTRDWGTVDVYQGTYGSADGPLAVELVDSETRKPIARLSVNMPEASEKLPRNCFYMKGWSENQRIADDAHAAKALFRYRPDIPFATSGWVTADAYELLEVA